MYKLCHIVWVEIALEKRIDWHSYGVGGGITLPPGEDIPRTCRYPNGLLKVTHTAIGPPSTCSTTDSSKDSDLDGANPPLLSTSPSAIQNRQTQAQKKAKDGLQDWDPHAIQYGTTEEQPPHGTTSSSYQLDFGG